MKAAQLFNAIDQKFGTRLSLAALFSTPTIEGLAKIVAPPARTAEEMLHEQKFECLIPMQPKGDRDPVYLVHAASGDVMMYRDLMGYLGPNQPLYGFESRGLSSNKTPLQTIEEMAELYVHELLEHQPHGPYHLGGYCLGGSIAYEMASRLTNMGHQVGMVALIETYNWSELRMSFARRVLTTIERVAFAAMNALQLAGKERRRFLSKKIAVEKQRIWTRLFASKQASNQVAAEIRKLNHRASFAYHPPVYSGQVLHVRPNREFSVVTQREEWDRFAQGGVNQLNSSAFPGGTIVAGYASQVADGILQQTASRDEASNRALEDMRI